MEIIEQSKRDFAILVAFANSHINTRAVTSNEIFENLTNRFIWYVPRRTKSLVEGVAVLFYQAATGFRGHAIVTEILDASYCEMETLRNLGLYQLTTKLCLKEITVFTDPVKLGPIVNDVDFVTNKRYWGHSLRSTPRRISAKDFETITSEATACTTDLAASSLNQSV